MVSGKQEQELSISVEQEPLKQTTQSHSFRVPGPSGRSRSLREATDLVGARGEQRADGRGRRGRALLGNFRQEGLQEGQGLDVRHAQRGGGEAWWEEDSERMLAS